MTIDEVLTYIRRLLADYPDWAHAMAHVEAILSLLDDFFRHVKVEVRKEELYIAAIFHDAGYIEDIETHALRSVKIMEGLPLKNKELIKTIILEHDYPKKRAHEIKTTEGKILWDVDNLESSGYIGLIRVQEHARFLGKDLKWGVDRFFKIWRATPEHMHFDYTALLMQNKDKEERRYLPLLFKQAGLTEEEINFYSGVMAGEQNS